MPLDGSLLKTSPSFADLMRKLSEDDDASIQLLDKRARRRLVGDARQFCTWIGRRPEEVPLHPRTIQSLTKGWTGARFGVSDKRLANVLSSVRGLLRRSGCVEVDRKPARLVEGPWALLLASLHGSWAKPVLSPFVRWCVTEGIDPEDADDEVAGRYLTWREENAISFDRGRLTRQLRCAWNRAAALVPAWPQQRLSVGKGRPPILLPWSDFPQSFQADVKAYRRARGARAGESQERSLVALIASAHPGVDQQGGAKSESDPLAPRTLEAHIDVARLIASTLVRGGAGPESLASLADVTTPHAAAKAADQAQGRNGKDSAYAQNIVKVARSIRARWVGLSKKEEMDFKKLRRFAERELDLKSMRPANRLKLAQFDDSLRLRMLIDWPERRLAELEKQRMRGKPVTLSMALDAQAAVIGLLLMSLPVRRGTLALTRIDQHFRWPIKAGGLATLSYEPVETKTRTPIAALLPSWKVTLLRLYLAHYRPRLLLSGDTNNPYLFPGNVLGKPKSLGRLGKTLTRAVDRQVGVRINLHFFRHLTASLLLRKTRNLAQAQALLGHTDGSSVTKLYAEMESRWSAEELDRVTDELRGEWWSGKASSRGSVGGRRR